MVNYKKLLIREHSSILDAIKVIDLTDQRICFLINQKNKLIGSITDGDIRRSLVRKLDFRSKAVKICNKHPIYILENQSFPNKRKIEENCIPVLDKKKRIIKIKILNKKNNKINSAIIMAGGKGERLYPITKYIPKPLIKIKGKTLIENLIIKLTKAKIKNIKISVHHMHKKIQKNLLNKKVSLTKDDFIIEKKPLGTGGSIKLFKVNARDFYVINSDIELNVDFTKISSFHLDKKADLTIVSKQIINKLQFGKLNINSQFFVKSIEEKPITINYVSTGLYVLNKKVKKLIKSNQRINMDEIIKKAIINKMRVVSYPLYENWADLGTKRVLKKFQK